MTQVIAFESNSLVLPHYKQQSHKRGAKKKMGTF